MSELVPLVNERDEIIGFKDRAQITAEDINRATGLWMENSEGFVLLARRSSLKKNNPNLWSCAAAGTVAKDESYEESIRREAEEELGVAGLTPIPVAKLFHRSSNPHFVQWYRATLDRPLEDFRIQKEEVDEIRWFSKEEILSLLETNPEMFVPSFPEWLPLFLDAEAHQDSGV